jgi:hypothetical protein
MRKIMFYIVLNGRVITRFVKVANVHDVTPAMVLSADDASAASLIMYTDITNFGKSERYYKNHYFPKMRRSL